MYVDVLAFFSCLCLTGSGVPTGVAVGWYLPSGVVPSYTFLSPMLFISIYLYLYESL